MSRYITIITTVYNIAPYLERFFKCLGEQTFTDYEALIVDDGSTDNSLEICRAHAENDDRIRLVELEHTGISGARNTALGLLQTPFAASLDGDDFFERDYLKHLVDAQKKYEADLVISNVITRNEKLEETSRFPPRPEAVYEGGEIREVLPQLLREGRLNFLYSKIYRTSLLKDIRVEPDVMQGSDTMINCLYIAKARRIAVICDCDYNYIRFRSRSVTSFNGDGYYERLLRINLYVRDFMSENGLMTEEMENAVDGRILFAGKTALQRIAGAKLSKGEKYRRAEQIADGREYLSAYNRQRQRGNLGSARFRVVAPDEAKAYIDETAAVYRDSERDEKKQARRERCPKALLGLYRKIRRG